MVSGGLNICIVLKLFIEHSQLRLKLYCLTTVDVKLSDNTGASWGAERETEIEGGGRDTRAGERNRGRETSI